MNRGRTRKLAGTAGLELQGIRISRQGVPLLEIDATIAPGEVLTLMGPSGAGKSTLVSAIAGFLPPAFSCSGSIRLNGVEITGLPPERRRVGVLFQDSLLFPHFNVLENVLFALPRGGTKEQRHARAMALLAGVSMDGFAQADPDTLSGGQKARVALVRVLASLPSTLLLDEPFSRLDADMRDSVRRLVFSEVERRQLPALLVTHDQEDARAANGCILTL